MSTLKYKTYADIPVELRNDAYDALDIISPLFDIPFAMNKIFVLAYANGFSDGFKACEELSE